MGEHLDFAAARERMVAEQLAARGIRDPRVLEAMRNVPREAFLPQEIRADAYMDGALPIACSQTISQPLIVAMMTEALELSGEEHVLEIGTGSGYQAAVLSELAGDVVTVERHAELSQSAAEVLANLNCQNVTAVVGDGTLGWHAAAPYDRVIVTAAAAEIPAALLQQLRVGGILVAPLGTREQQDLMQVRKVPDGVEANNLGGCRFVPLVSDQDSK